MKKSLDLRAATTRGLALFLSVAVVATTTRSLASPADVFSSPAPAIGSDPPKAAELRTGESTVSTQTGALTYSYPISVPPGRGGMAPHLSLAYSSQAAVYGTIASGWSLPIPAILEDTSQGRLRTHSPQTEQQDGVGTAKYDDDRFISTMAGSRTLVRVTEPTSLGVGWTYRAQADASYTRYERMSQGQPFFWRAYTSAGNVLTFGETSRMGNCQNVGWGFAPLTGEVDSFGNKIAYFYKTSNTDAQDCVIDRITWGMNSNAGITYPFAQVKFGWTAATTLAPGSPAFSLGSQRDYRCAAPV